MGICSDSHQLITDTTILTHQQVNIPFLKRPAGGFRRFDSFGCLFTAHFIYIRTHANFGL